MLVAGRYNALLRTRAWLDHERLGVQTMILTCVNNAHTTT